MRGNGTVYKRCGCRDPHIKRQLGRRCPKFAQPGHGAWYVSPPAWATADDPRARLRQGSPQSVTTGTMPQKYHHPLLAYGLAGGAFCLPGGI